MPTWMQRGNCAAQADDGFYPKEHGGRDALGIKAAKRVCQGCPVIQECLAWALDHREEFGVWGGLSTRERHALIKQRAA